jgi:predicted MFS family arabinose efflux permease
VRNRAERPDILGTVALAAGVGCIVLGITEGAAWHWVNGRTLTSLLAGVLLVAVVLWRSMRHAVPAVQIALWRSRTFALANIVSLCFGAALYAWLLCGAFFLVNVWHYTELNAGLALSPGAVFSAISAIGVGRLTGRWRDPRVAVCAGTVLMLATTALLTFYLPATPHFLALWLPTVLIGGFGIGAVSTGVSSAAALSVMPQQFAAATGLNMAARQVGGALGIGVLAALLTTSGSTQPTPYAHILLFCTLTLALAGIAGLGLVLRPAAAPAAQTTAPRTTDATA